MRTEPVTEDTVARHRESARHHPATGLPEPARCLLEYGWQIDRQQPGVQAVLFARSGARDERPGAGQPAPIGIDPDRNLQPVLGGSFHRWAFSVRQTYRAGLDASVGNVLRAAHSLPQPPAAPR
jgi:hypothetical protein